MFIEALFLRAPNWNQASFSTDDWLSCGTSVPWNTSQQSKNHTHNLDESPGNMLGGGVEPNPVPKKLHMSDYMSMIIF